MLLAEGKSRGSATVESEAESSMNGFLGEETMLAEVVENKKIGEGRLERNDEVYKCTSVVELWLG